MRIFLSGAMGSGKSSVAPVVGQKAGVPLLDLDATIEEEAGCTVRELFRREGEAAFREREATVLRRRLPAMADCVVALGGGTVTRADLRRELLRLGTLITLDAPVPELVARVGSDHGRPLLAGQDPRVALERLLSERADAYAECHARIETAGRSPESVADDVLAVARAAPIVVALGRRSYRVEVGAGCRAALPERVRVVATSPTVVVVSDANVWPRWGVGVRDALARDGRRVIEVILEPGEQHKNLASIERIWRAALEGELDRGGTVVGVGGGVVGDLAGFGASTLLRGVPVGHVPTTLLAMVDSAVGGKTGFDMPQGKNLIGTFHQPSFVLCDVEVLGTLPEKERRAGLAEVVKCAWIAGALAVERLEADAPALLAGEVGAIERAVRTAVAVKAEVVSADERDHGRRAVLNLGHTVGHAIEAARGYQGIRHGEAVALGMVAAMRVAIHLGCARVGDAERMLALLSALGLPTDLDAYAGPEVLRYVGADKKRLGGTLTFIAPGAPGAISVVPVAPDRLEPLVFPRRN
jgi:3-dehydroquinate synthase